MIAGNMILRCALGKGGITAFKREGDGATPLARMRLLYGFKRPDKKVTRHECPGARSAPSR